MKPFHVFHLLLLISLTAASTATLKYAKDGCQDMCGDVIIPYPFGIGSNCSLNKWYAVDCNSSRPYLSALNNLQVLKVDLETVTVNISMMSGCQNPVGNSTYILSLNLGESPFLFSTQNVLMVRGCGKAVILDHGSVLTGCSTRCVNGTISEGDTCFGIGCCQARIFSYLKSYTVDFTGLTWQDNDGACGSAFLVDKKSYDEGRFSGNSTVRDNSFVPISLKWTLTNDDMKEVDCSSYGPSRSILLLGNGTSLEFSDCSCLSYDEGNPYLRNGCQEPEECKRCREKGLVCVPYGSQNFTCRDPYGSHNPRNPGPKLSLGVILGVSISMGLLCLTTIIYALHKLIIKTKVKRRKEKFFKRNGGLLLKQQEGTDKGLVDKTIHFTTNVLEKATDHFNENRILGRGGQGTVYKGMLTDGRIVAIKKSKVVNESQLEQFINEVVVLSQVNHRNVVKLLGCCLETEVPLLVSEFISNGTLYDHIHDDTNEFPISLIMRLQIATEAAGALSYLHSATSIPIYHRDIKTTNILLDEKYRAKVSDFGTSRFVSMDQTHLTTLVKGTFGYLDPEYFQSSQFTEKSDVYSFGVVLVELLTGERPISLTRFGENRSLVTHFMLAMEEGRVMSIFDAIVIKEGSRDELMIVANLAMRCLNFSGKNRPTMKEVAIELEGIRMSYVLSTPQPNVGPVKYDEKLSMLTYGDSISTTISFVDNIDQ